MKGENVVLNVAVGQWYPRGQERLKASLPDENTWFRTEYPDTPHEHVPYKFKVDAFKQALAAGYERAIWLDSSCIALKPMPWALLKQKGHLFGEEGWPIGQWCNDYARRILGVSEEEKKLPLMEGKIIGLDFTDPRAREFLDQWYDAARIGAFNGSWENHRHDITCGAVIAHRLGMELTPHLVTLMPDEPHSESYVLAGGM